jgi:ribosomal protein S18 acetylase RimI-like enzyme
MPIRKVEKKDEKALRKMAKEFLEPIYGNQEKAINEWLTGSGFKNVFIFADDLKVMGLLSLKANPNKSYLKISTLIVNNGCRDKNVGRELLGKALVFALENNYRDVIVTVSEMKEDALGFFMCAGFGLVKKCHDKYIKGISEYILRRTL